MSKKSITIHFAAWLFYWLLASWLLSSGSPSVLEEFIFFLIIAISQAGLFYLNAFWWVPRFFEQKKYAWYFIILLLVISGLTTVIEWFMYLDTKSQGDLAAFEEDIPFFSIASLLFNSTPILLALLGSFIYKMMRNARKREKRERLLVEAESKFLKSQMNPHFLFNALNNIYAMAQLKLDSTPGAIFQLSEILRYILYESNKKEVSLEKEIKYLKSFIQLSLLKEEESLQVNTNFENINPKLQIVPLLLIPFVENSFKHSNVEDQEKGWIEINLSCENQYLCFSIKNSIGGRIEAKDEQGGIGLENTHRRLNLLYPEKHELKILRNEKDFAVHLKIELHEN